MSAREEIIAMVRKFPADAPFSLIIQELQRQAIGRTGDPLMDDSDVDFHETAEERERTLAAIREGEAAIKAGDFKTQEEVRAIFNSWVAEWPK